MVHKRTVQGLKAVLIFFIIFTWLFPGWQVFDWSKKWSMPEPVAPVKASTGVKSVQSGTMANTTNGTVTTSITSITASSSFIVFQSRSNVARPVDSIRGSIVNATTISFIRTTSESPVSTVNIQWYVVEFASGVTVQSGTISQSATTVNQTINAVSAINQAFVLISKTVLSGDGGYSADDITMCNLTAVTTLTCQANAIPASPYHTVQYQVVNFTNSADINVQIVTSTSILGTGSLSGTLTIPTAVATSSTFLLCSHRMPYLQTNSIGEVLVRAVLTNSTTITLTRGVATTNAISEIMCQVVELKNGSTVQHNTQSFAKSASQATATISNIDTNRSIAFASTQFGDGGQSIGDADYSTVSSPNTDIVGVSSYTFALSSATSLVIDRNNTATTSNVGWFVVQFAPAVTQSGYGFYANADSTDVGTALAATNTPAALTYIGDAFRLRLLLHFAGGTLAASETTYKLQYVGKGTGTCASPSGGTPASYTDVSGSTLIAFYDNSTPSDGSNLTENASDPIDGSDTVVYQTYEEANNFTNSRASIATGQDGKWDFALYDNGAATNTVYCFRAVNSNDVAFDTYTVYPVVTTSATAAPVISVTITSDGSISYGTLSLGATTNTLASSLNDTQTAQNSGNVTENLTIKGQNTACPWTLASVTSSDQYVHEFSTSSGSAWVPLTTSYQTLTSSIASSVSQNFDLRISAPTSTNCGTSQSVDVTVQASAA